MSSLTVITFLAIISSSIAIVSSSTAIVSSSASITVPAGLASTSTALALYDVNLSCSLLIYYISARGVARSSSRA